MTEIKRAPGKYSSLLLSACIMLIFFELDSMEQQASPVRLSEIAAAGEPYKGATVSMKLKLKTVDEVFEKIIFYDEKNHDIVFDISARVTKKKLKKQMANIHEGMDYFVTFKVDKTDNSGMIIAELVDFKPVILDRLP